MRIVKSTVVPVITDRDRLLEKPRDRENQRLGMLMLLNRWFSLYELAFDAVDMGEGAVVDYVIVAEGTYTGGVITLAAGQVEYKRRYETYHYKDLFIEQRKVDALIEHRRRLGGVPIFMAEWDDVYLLVDARVAKNGRFDYMARMDRNLAEDTDPGYYVPNGDLHWIRKPPR